MGVPERQMGMCGQPFQPAEKVSGALHRPCEAHPIKTFNSWNGHPLCLIGDLLRHGVDAAQERAEAPRKVLIQMGTTTRPPAWKTLLAFAIIYFFGDRHFWRSVWACAKCRRFCWR